MNGFGLAFRLARRELRGGLKGFSVFIACLTLGVAAIAAVGSLNQSVVAGLAADGRSLLGGDIDVRVQQTPADAAQMAYLKAGAGALSAVVQMRAMARPEAGVDSRALVELKAVDRAYPLVGALATKPEAPLASLLEKRDGAWGVVVDANLLTKLGVEPGARLRIGDAEFAVRATVVREPDRVASMLSFGPRALIAEAALPDTGLVQPGSQIAYHYRLALPAGVDPEAWGEAASAAFPDAGWRIRSLDDAAPGVRRFIDRMTLFLTFVGLTALLIGGIGIGNGVKSYLDGRTATIATLKCLGASGQLVFSVYLIQIMGLACAGVVLGLLLGGVAPIAVAAPLAGLLPVPPRLGLYPIPLMWAAAFGLLTAATFALWPLARARDVPAANLFRAFVAPLDGRPRARYVALVAAGIAGLAALTVAGSGDTRAALWFVGGSLVAFTVLRGAATLIMRLSARVARPSGAEWRLALANLHRPGASTPSVVVSLGLGLAVLVAVVLIQGNLSRQIGDRLPKEAPALFFIDIQPDQVAAFDETVAAVPEAGNYRRVPTLRGRIVKIAGVPVEQVTIAPDVAWAVRGDRALTYAAEPSEDSEIVAGEWWPVDYAGPPLISLDAAIARGFGVGLGDTLTFNVLGREIEARIVALREIDWRSLRFDFAVIFAPGTLEGAPQSFIGAIHAPPGADAAIEKTVTERFANISTIRVRDALEAVARILAGVGGAVRAAASVTIVAGVLVLAGAVAAARRRRLYDSIVFKVLGATRQRVLKAFVLEYGILGLATGAIAAVIGGVTAWAVIVFLMESPWVLLPGAMAATLGAGLLVTLAVGFAGTWRALGQKAAPYLRNE
ncbi:MAG: ABC transporter permease [Rhodospirillales bacterium]|nr:ABC transporter permease [Rhodospirillales bacterium]